MPPKLDNVQRLLAAEEKRNNMIAEAKLKKQQKVRLAKADAESEVAAFRSEKDGEYDTYRSQQMTKASEDHMMRSQETDVELKELQELTQSRIHNVANLITSHILTVQVE